ncbi:DUF2971 domain-containing protein [Caulobacter sp. NIBR1757]|uniref:DUF2971 domain-containing protein n=1 Tax=Caulobacter sp. NIBR1757 TaxID=3016000 RepID=UPI0022F0F353|nr:DUF2971 domain-containing protein [Caulobacter sp. NIBR1757]WGM37530.1 hypothetical protein AMEJIAPC_00429 [Caulobacter sp. NIBR1757]
MPNSWIDQFVECFSPTDGRHLNIEQAFILKHAKQPTSIFKFRAVTDYALANLSDDTVWLNSPSNYNDPFDCAAALSPSDLMKASLKDPHAPIPFDEIAARIGSDLLSEALSADNPLREIAHRLLSSDPKIDHTRIPEMIEAIEQSYIAVSAPYLSQTVSKIKDSLKICSFCATKEPILMWSHYANNHRGFCVEYATDDLHDMARRMLFPVIYSEKLFDSTPYHTAAMKDLESFNNLYPILQALYKAPEWAYEQEWRLVFAGGVIAEEMNYYIGSPKAVYLGARISDEDRDGVLAVCRQRRIPVSQMRLATDKFRLEATPRLL